MRKEQAELKARMAEIEAKLGAATGAASASAIGAGAAAATGAGAAADSPFSSKSLSAGGRAHRRGRR